ncbi:MAG: type II toxin-antitoxin system HipA family toxin [Acidobacteriaceae bacterium]|jgi:serine/threonine-protein kinase HipA|nr:type II toxin-antitoxin system HipA family toxin [Acidobacteriaceae bacterium]
MPTKRAISASRPSVLEVHLADTVVGTITNLPNDQNLFVFDDAYIADQDRPVLSLSFYDAYRELRTNIRPVTRRLPSFFSNLLPEGQLRQYIAEHGEVNEQREFFLLWLLGNDLPGAVTVHDTEGRTIPPAQNAPTKVRTKVGKDVLRFSLAGVQLKLSAIGNPNRQLSIPASSMGGHWIVKLPSLAYPHLPENEYSMMHFAREIGIDVPEMGLIPLKEIENIPDPWKQFKGNAYYIKRFDRAAKGKRVHIEDFNQIYGQFPEAKYRNYSYTNIAADIWRLMDQQQFTEFVRRLIFNAAIGNNDMHLKNWSLIYPDGKMPQLSPAYDFVSTIRYIADHRLALSIAKEKVPSRLNSDLLRRFAQKAQVPTELVLQTARETAENVMVSWPKLQKELPLDRETRLQLTAHMKSIPLLNE